MRRCSNCGHEGPAQAQCPRCKSWGTMARYQRLADIPRPEAGQRLSSGIDALDELLGGGGFVRGVVYRFSGDPGAGKSTLALDAAIRIASREDLTESVRCLYVCGEESPENVRARADDRLRAQIPPALAVSRDGSVEELAHDVPDGLDLVVIDSLNAWRSPDLAGEPGSNGQMVHAARGLNTFAEKTGAAVLALSHVNKDGDAAGTVAIDHWLEATLIMRKASDDEEQGTLRITKNRHGPAPLSLNYVHGEKGIELS